MADLLEVCRAGQLSSRDSENPYTRSSNGARAFARNKYDFAKSETIPVVFVER